jgi:hypothetical protein
MYLGQMPDLIRAAIAPRFFLSGRRDKALCIHETKGK